MSISTRVLRKFQGDRDFPANDANEGSETEEIPFAGGARKKQLNVNRYDLLNQQSQSESEVKEDDDDENEQENASANLNNGRVSTKKKKKKKRKKTLHSNHRQSGDYVDEIDKTVKEVNAILGETCVKPTQVKRESSGGGSISKKGVLSVEYKHLNPSNELKRIFGPKIIQNENSRRRGRGHRSRASCLVTPKEHWPLPYQKLGLSMKFLETKNDCQYFTFEHSNAYQNVERKFLEAVESLDPDNLVAVANSHPYHLNTLIQLSDICKLGEDLAMAAELIEKALYSLEVAFHPLFNIAKGNCRLDYRRQENRALYITLFKHLVFVGQRACYRTALEFCKLILSLSPEEDPLAIVLTMDFYALRARQFTWLLQFIEETESERHLTQLPNMAFGKAIALYHLSDPGASEALQDALIMFPGVLFPLLEKCSVKPDPKTRSHSFFAKATFSQPPALKCLIQLYVQRSFHLWKEPEILSWLEKNTLEILDRVDNKDPLIEEYAEKRKRRYEAKSPRPIDRHLFLADIKEVTAVLAENATISTTFSFDPLPPADSINIYTRAQNSPRTHEHTNAVSLFFRSLMPNFELVPDELVNGDDIVELEIEGAVGRAYLHNSFTSLLDAMSNLFSNFRASQHQEESPAEDEMNESLGDTRYDDDELNESLGDTRYDDDELNESLGDTRYDEDGSYESFGDTRFDEDGSNESLGDPRFAEDGLNESLGDTRFAEDGLNESLGDTRFDEDGLNESLGDTRFDEDGLNESLGDTINDEDGLNESLGDTINDEDGDNFL